jgi:hypothetical protein
VVQATLLLCLQLPILVYYYIYTITTGIGAGTVRLWIYDEEVVAVDLVDISVRLDHNNIELGYGMIFVKSGASGCRSMAIRCRHTYALAHCGRR